jgi:PAS domain S-box-containing protein
MSTTLHDYAFVYDRSGEYLEAIVGRQESDLYTREEIVGLRVPEVFPEPVADRLLDTIETALETGEVETVEYPLEKPGGTSWYEAHMARIPGGYGGQPAVLTSAMDVTERREREQALERQNERLERFANIVSHDLRNPLDIAMGRTQIARETGDLEHLDSVATALERMEELVGDLLTLAREGEAVGDLAEVSLAEVAADCWETVDTADAELVVETDRRILADGGRLRQLLENLVRNAVEHAGPEVTVTVGDCEGGFYVADDGPGIEAPERVFESGYTTRDDGTGFGLAIVEQITHAHGWSVTAVDDDGARFEVTGVETP